MICNRNRIRVKGNTAQPYAELVNILTGGAPKIPRARALRIELGLYCDDTFETDLTDIVSITAELKPFSNRTSAALASVTASTFNDITENQWLAGGAWHVALEIEDTDMAFDMGGATNLPLWLVITAETDQGTVTLAAGPASMEEDGGLVSANTPAAGDPGYYNKEQIDAMLASLGAGNVDKIIDSPSLLSTGTGYRRRLSIDDNGTPIDSTTYITP